MKSPLHYLILCLCLIGLSVDAQILTEGFNDDSQFNKSHQFFTDGSSDYFGIFDPTGAAHDFDGFPTPPGGVPIYSGNTDFYLVGEDLDGGPDPATQTLTWTGLNISGFTALVLSVDLAADLGGFDPTDEITFEANIDAAGFNVITQFNGSVVNGVATDGVNNLSLFFQTITNSIVGTGATLDLRLTVTATSGNEEFAIDNVIITGTPGVGCPHTITSIAPNTGTVGTEVTIRGTAFTGSSTVTFNGIAATSVNFINGTTLIATLPAGGTSGLVVVTETACNVTAASSFIVLGQSGSCGVPFPDLIISEIYDAASGSLGYIEIYNGTGAAIQLADYRIDRYTQLVGGVLAVYTFPTMIIANGQVVVGRVSNDANAGGITPNFTFGTTSGGFNADDRLELVLISSGAIIDDWHDDAVTGTTGYSYLRSTTIIGPNPTYTTSEWAKSGTESTADVGLYSVTPGGIPSITVEPVDANSCAINLSVTAIAGGAGLLTYRWFFNENDGIATSWTAVTGATLPGTIVVGETSSFLSITGNLSSVNGYQFYCEVIEGGSCSIISETIQFELDAERFFRSVMTGDWTNVATWEMANTTAGPWTITCVYPEFGNSDYIHIQSGDVVSVDQDIVVDEVVIETGGTISINNNRLLAFNNGTGIDLEIQGTLIDNGNGGGNGINFSANSGTWTLATNGEVIKTGSSSVAQYRNNYDGGIATIPATATWRFRHDGNSTTIAVLTLNMFYPNLHLESTSGNHSFTGTSEIFQGISGFMTVKGSMYVGNSGTGSVDVFTKNTNASPLQVLGNLVIGGNGSIGTSTLENNEGGTAGTGIEVHGNLMIYSNGLLDLDDGTAATDGTIRLHGNWTDQNTGSGFAEGESTVEFIGTATQSINKVSGNEHFYNVIVNKASGNLQNNATNMVIKNDMTFTNGIVLTSATAYLLFEAAATATTASNASHTDGPIIKETNSGSITAFTYPTGDNSIYGAIGIETRFHNGESYIAEYFNVGYGIYNVNTAELDHVSSSEYWMLDELTGGSGENLKVTLHWGPHSNVISPTSIRVGHFYTEAPSAVDQWEREGASPLITATATSGTVTSDYVTSFSPFTLVDIITQLSLPLELLRFEATKVDRRAELFWEIANEKATDRYCLERSKDAISFETLACYDATSDHALMTYFHLDETPFSGDNYYRIHQIDYLKMHNYSPTRVLSFEDHNGLVSVYPSPANNQVTIEMPDLLKGHYNISIIDVLGRTLVASEIAEGESVHNLDTKDLTAGTYLLQVKAPNGSLYTEKVIIRH
jgi:hypothetical protein